MMSSNSSFATRGAKFASAALLVAALLWLAAAPALAQSAIRVLVNDEPITSYDIQQRAKMMNVFSRGQQGEKQAIEQLIEERLMLQEAKLRNVNIGDEEVEQEFANRARGAKLTADRFTQALRQAGIDPRTFKDFLRANLAWTQIVRARFRATINVTDQDVAAALTEQEPTAEAQTALEYRIQQIIFIVPAGAAAGVEAQQRSAADAFRSAFQGCEQSLQQAASAPGIVVKPQVRREAGQLPPALKEAFASLEVGGTSEPERVADGFQIVAICAKNEIAGQTEATVETRDEISTERGQLLARRYLRDLRSDAVIEYR